MAKSWHPQNGFGLSWGLPGFRVGRSEYGTWWVSIGLPFGFRMTKRLGRLKDPVVNNYEEEPSPVEERPLVQRIKPISPISSGNISSNQKILKRMKSSGGKNTQSTQPEEID